MLAQSRPQLIPTIPPAARFAVFGIIIAALVYGMSAMSSGPATKPNEDPVTTVVPVPVLDNQILATAKDGDREQRLLLEAEPLRHLLQKAIDVGPTVAAALAMPEQPVPVAVVRQDLGQWRHRWIYYEGQLEDLAGPRDGNPVPGYSIYEATVRLADGEAVLAAFSLPPGPGIERGSWVRVEGYLLKLRDTTYPRELNAVPMLVGRQIQLDHQDWGKVTALDPELLAKIDDRSFWPGDPMWHTIEEDQTEALWHLAAYARDTADTRTLADWRRIPILDAEGVHKQLNDGNIARGTPLRVFGTLIQRTTVAAPSNPAGIHLWTVAWIQVREYGGTLVPIWVPKRTADLPWKTPLEVRGFFYRWQAYETLKGERRRAPLFVAADLDVYNLEVDRTMQGIGAWLGGITVVLLVLAIWSQRRAARTSLQHSIEMDRRRRRRRERGTGTPVAPTPSSSD
jgi:hypothetical protein